MIRKATYQNRKLVAGIVLICLGTFFIPVDVPDHQASTVIYGRNGQLMGASIAPDEQWRFPKADSVPYKLQKCILLFEDEYFHWHPGINPVSVFRAAHLNITSGKIVSGASTITMQLARMLRGKKRDWVQKLIEMWMAVRLEVYHSKAEILNEYVSIAPFGGNVIGISAASWRYFGRPSHMLSWAESAALAVLPNQPGVIYPGKSSDAFRTKRDLLLEKLLERQIIDTLTYRLSLDEPLPTTPHSIPQLAPHLLTTLNKSVHGRQIRTTIDAYWQSRTTELVERKHRVLKSNGVDNLAAMVIDLQDGRVLSYVGNTTDPEADGFQNDLIQAPRSSGSILKPLLYVKAMDKGIILPETILPDIPTFFGGYSPKNFDLGYKGIVKANQALSMSLNIPFTHLLSSYKYEQFHQDLRELGFTTLSEAPGHYGLSMILGGAEIKLWDLTQAYFSVYRKLAMEQNLEISYISPKERKDIEMEEISIWNTFSAMTELSRPGQEKNWETFSSSQQIAWKTGTSFGFRDAWAIGINGSVLVGVWVGNADGEGRAGLTGLSSAGPVLMELLKLSDYSPNWLNDLKPFSFPVEVCSESGMLASDACVSTKMTDVGTKAEFSGLCNYHQKIWMSHSGEYQINRSCYEGEETITRSFFILPPVQGYYYQKTNPSYMGSPPMHPDCMQERNDRLAINYPNQDAKVYIPRELSGTMGEVVVEASHQDPSAALFWHINEKYIGETQGDHKKSLQLARGHYQITIVDQLGNTVSRNFEVVSDRI